MIATPMLMVYEEFLWLPLPIIGTVLMYVAALLSLWSAFLYSFSTMKKMQELRMEKRKEKKLRRENP